jgi:glycosyltransferase 2 family protein
MKQPGNPLNDLERDTTGGNAPSDALERPRPPTHKWRHLLQVLILTLAVYFLLPQITTLSHSMEVLRQMKWWAVGLAFGTQCLSYAGSGYLVRATAGLAGQTVSVRLGSAVTIGSASIGLVAGGTFGAIATAYHWLRDRGVNAQGASLASSLPVLFFNNALMFSAAIFGLIHLLVANELNLFEALGFGFAALFLAGIAVFFLWGLNHRSALVRLVERGGRWWAGVRKRPFREELASEVLDPLWSAWALFRSGGWLRPTVGALLNVGFDFLTLFLLFVAVGHPLDPASLLVGYGLPQLLARFAFLPGGIGVVEGSMAALYHGLGVPEAVSVVVIMAYRGLSFWLPTLIGFPVAAYLEHRQKKGSIEN